MYSKDLKGGDFYAGCEYVASMEELHQRLRVLKQQGYHESDFIVIGGGAML